jgi:hypothetical protein
MASNNLENGLALWEGVMAMLGEMSDGPIKGAFCIVVGENGGVGIIGGIKHKGEWHRYSYSEGWDYIGKMVDQVRAQKTRSTTRSEE